MEYNSLIYIGELSHKPSLAVAQRYASVYGLRLRTIPRNEFLYNCDGLLRDAAFAVIWNGEQGNTGACADYCRAKRVPHCFLELGLLPQHKTYLIDRRGFCGRSSLCGDLGWVTPTDMAQMRREREALLRRHRRAPDGSVLVPLQVPNDTQVFYHWSGRTMQDLVQQVESMYPGREIVFRPHPKITDNSRLILGPRSSLRAEGLFLDQAARASVVVGVTSTCLYEASLLGVPTVALGDHPLRAHRDHERVLAGLLAHRFDSNGSPWNIMERFSVRPLGALPLSEGGNVAEAG